MQSRFDEVLRVLHDHDAEFILVGGIAAILQGSPLTTEDVDVVYVPSEANCRRLVAALQTMDATYADPAGREIHPDRYKLATHGVNLLNTRLGRVDLMQTVGDGLDYEALLPNTQSMVVDDFQIRVLELETLIETKEQADRPKDHYQLPFLRQLLAEVREREGD